ncbi:MAG: hypothetical protein R3A45_07805 [Bdellovibrionota bacterium]
MQGIEVLQSIQRVSMLTNGLGDAITPALTATDLPCDLEALYILSDGWFHETSFYHDPESPLNSVQYRHMLVDFYTLLERFTTLKTVYWGMMGTQHLFLEKAIKDTAHLYNFQSLYQKIKLDSALK